MPRTRDLSTYPTAYWSIIEDAAMRARTTRVPARDLSMARSIRGHWYAFIGSLKAERTRIRLEMGRAKREATDYEARVLETTENTARVCLRITGTPGEDLAVEFGPRENDWIHQALSHATVVDSTERSPTISDAEASLARLQSKLKESK
jgi:hypothetical protein